MAGLRPRIRMSFKRGALGAFCAPRSAPIEWIGISIDGEWDTPMHAMQCTICGVDCFHASWMLHVEVEAKVPHVGISPTSTIVSPSQVR